jgi:uracil-DNA glycosylase
MTRTIVLAHEVDWGGWRTAARQLTLDGVAPDAVTWSVRAIEDAAETPAHPAAAAPGGFNVPRALVDLAQAVIQARDPDRFALLHRLLARVHAGERQLLDDMADPDVQRARSLARAVQRDTLRMRALIRLHDMDGAHAIGWLEPEHYVLEANAAVFAERFAPLAWSILTPYRAAHWNGDAVCFTAGAAGDAVPDDVALAAYWRTHFRGLFGPKVTAGAPCHAWRNLPQPATLVPAASPPPATTVAAAAREAAGCRVCRLWEPATQTVFGEGPADARLMCIGEQPGDQEDLAGRPFVGPAGQLLDTALAEAGIDRARIYITNAVKHFKFEPRGRRRIHAKPDNDDIAACKFWLDLERQEIRPAVTVLLGATAARAVLGRVVTISRERSRPIALDGNSQALVTVHPSYLLRLPDEASRRREYAAFVADLRHARTLLEG